MECKITILFEDPFWISLVERHDDEGYSVAKYTFGKEPNDEEIMQFLKNEYKRLKFSKPTNDPISLTKKKNYKRVQREIKKEIVNNKLSSKALEAMKKSYEENKQEKKVETKEQKEADRKRKYLLAQDKKKEKRKGH
jgi:methylthioribose-1-phosphate isomerase